MARFITAEQIRKAEEAYAEISVERDTLPFYTMASGEQKQKSKGGGGDDGDDSSDEGGQKLAEKGEELKEEMDNLLDEIDSVLEENAEEFVKNYVQRGGQ